MAPSLSIVLQWITTVNHKNGDNDNDNVNDNVNDNDKWLLTRRQVLAEDSDNQDKFIEDGLVSLLFELFTETRIPQLKLHIMEILCNFLYHETLEDDPRLTQIELTTKYNTFFTSHFFFALFRTREFDCHVCDAASCTRLFPQGIWVHAGPPSFSGFFFPLVFFFFLHFEFQCVTLLLIH